MAVTLIYETHSITVDNEQGIATGWLPGELSGRGRALAVEMGPRRAGVDVVYASDLRRAVQTAELAFGDSREVRTDSRLRECDYGVYNGRPVDEVAPLRRKYIDEPWPGGQSYRDVVSQTVSFLDDLRELWQGRTVLVVAHSANRWALQHLLHGVPLEDLVDAPFEWQPGWTYSLGWPR